MTDLADFAALVPGEHGLCVVSTLRAAGTIQSSVVNAGVLAHPVTGATVVAFTTRGGTAKLVNLRARPRATVVIRFPIAQAYSKELSVSPERAKGGRYGDFEDGRSNQGKGHRCSDGGQHARVL